MAELIEMPFWLWTKVGQRNHVLNESSVPPTQRGNFQGKGLPTVKYRDSLPSAVNPENGHSWCGLLLVIS